MRIFCLLGKSASGKDTIQSEIAKKGLLDVIVSSTTRKPRSSEIDGIAYNFISEKDFLDKLDKGYFLEHTEYHVATNEIWHYGIDGSLLDKNKDYIVIVNPHGFHQLCDKLGKENVVGILIKADDRERLMRSLYRENNPNCEEICRRYLADTIDFQDIESEVKYIINNNNLEQSVNIVKRIIEKESTINSPELEIGTKVKIIKILNTEKAGHLLSKVGRTGYILSKINYKNIIRYKILLDEITGETAYFRRKELEEC